MVLQYSEGFPSLRWNEREQRVWVETSIGFDKEIEKFYQHLEKGELDPFKMTEDFARGLRILKDLSSEKNRKEIRYIKGQITGPVTFGLALIDQEGKPIFYDPTLREILIKHLSLKARWMEKRFNDLFPGIPTILFFDEPSLSSFGSAFSSLNREDVIHSLNECFDAVKGLKGVHCCGNTDWSVLLSTNLDLLSFDAYEYLETLSLYPKELRFFLERGGILAWGIIPTSEAILKEDAQGLVKRLNEGMETFSKKGIDPILLQRAIITPSCGAASLPIPLAERVCELTAEVSKRLRDSLLVS
jgi:methionine synthase II (cobalamin-independent)